jgi:uncharacterized membrane protein
VAEIVNKSVTTFRVATSTGRPLDILQRRLARGEISVEEYEELRDTLIGRRDKAPA